MSGYSINERKFGKSQRRPIGATCGNCGEPVEQSRLMCDDCITDIGLGMQVLSDARRER